MDSNVLLFNSPPQRNVWLPTILETLALYCQTSVNFGSSVLPVPGIGLLYPLIPTEGSKSGVAMKLPPKLDAKPKALIAEFERLGSTVSPLFCCVARPNWACKTKVGLNVCTQLAP